eukprot:1174300-Rhodomonas_salina.1
MASGHADADLTVPTTSSETMILDSSAPTGSSWQYNGASELRPMSGPDANAARAWHGIASASAS